MNKIYLSYNNIISSLGFDSETVVQNIHTGVSGLSYGTAEFSLPFRFPASRIPAGEITSAFTCIGNPENYTRLEQMLILSLKNTIGQSGIALTDRVGLIISTTKGNIDVLEKDSPFDKSRAYLHVLGKKVAHFFGFKNEAIIISNACVSGILAVAVAKRYINMGVYDHVLVAAGDLVTAFTVSGFNSFQALSEQACKPFDKNRNGINIGEAAASTLVTNSTDYLWEGSVEIAGEASRNDANHISGPSRTGEGLYLSIQSACKQAGVEAGDIDYVSAHGTATLYNDEMEAIALNRMNLKETPVNSLKGYFGHTLGASGLLEAIIGVYSLKNNTLYKTLGYEELGVSQPVNIITKVTEKPLNTFLKMASGFGGCNTAVVFKKYQ